MKTQTNSSASGLKLNYKRTFIIGFAFFGILMLWQIYNTYCPTFVTQLLVNQFGGVETDWQYVVGIIMACDNIFALVMLPLFGSLSDKTKSKYGKRMPYIVFGTIAAAIFFPLISVCYCYNSIAGTIIMMALVLVAMNVYRNPAVSLMPDITPKPLRSRANAIINMVGYIGAIIAGAIALFLPFQKINGNTLLTLLPFLIGTVLLLITGFILFWRIKENKVVEEMASDMERGEKEADVVDVIVEDKPLSKTNKIALILLIIAVFLWFAGFNAVETFWSNYAVYYLNASSYSLAPIVLTVASLISFFPASLIADKIGRKWTVVIGIALVAIPLLVCFFVQPQSATTTDPISLPFFYYIIFGVAGIGWAFINCCSYPMVVELASKKNVGKYTGYYYASSMLAQSITPICVGFLFQTNMGWRILFLYGAILLAVALIVFIFVKSAKFPTIHKNKDNSDK